MKCGKCGTPILPGEDYCRICGTKYESTPTPAPIAEPVVETLEVPVAKPVVETLAVPVAEPVVETLAVPVAEPIVETLAVPVAEPVVETLEVPVTEPVVETLEVPITEPVVETLEVPVTEPVVETLEAPVTEPVIEEIVEPIAEIPEAIVEPIIETPVVEPTMEVIEETIEPVNPVIEEKESLEEMAKSFELAKELDLNSEPVEEPKEEKTEEEVEEPKEEKNKKGKKKKEEDSEKSIEEIIAKNNRKPNVAFIVTLILLIISIALNVILFLNKGEENTTPDGTGNEIALKKIYYENYSMNVDYNWIYTMGDELVFNDKSENWGASLQIINADYAVFAENKDGFNDILNNYALEMTSKTEKVVNNKTLYIFSGKYNSYITDVIISDLGNNQLLKVQLLYKGEKDDIVLNKVYELMTSMTPFNTTLLNDTTFKFESLEEAVLENSISKVSEEGNKEKTE